MFGNGSTFNRQNLISLQFAVDQADDKEDLENMALKLKDTYED